MKQQPIRRDKQVNILVPLLREIQFFKTHKIKEEDLRYICKKLKYEFVPEGIDVIKIGEFGQEFFITLYGSVGVLLPNIKKSKPQEEKQEKEVAKNHDSSSSDSEEKSGVFRSKKKIPRQSILVTSETIKRRNTLLRRPTKVRHWI